MNIALAGFFTYISVLPPMSDTERSTCAIEPHIRPLLSYFGTDALIKNPQYCIDHIKIIQDVMAGKILSYEKANFEYRKDTVTLFEYDVMNDPGCILHPQQLIRMISAFHLLLTEGKKTLMEVEIIKYTPYFEEYPIPDKVKALPLIKLTDPIPLPPLN